MRILAVLYCYPPLLVPAAMCYLKLMASLIENDVEVEILTIAPDSFDSPGLFPLDETLSAVLPSQIKNHVVWSPENSFLIQTIKRMDPSRRFSYRWLEPKKREWLGPALRHLETLDLGRFDLLLTCSQPHANHLFGLELRKRTKLPWVAYFSDPWTENPYTKFASDRIRAHHRRFEDEVLRSADLVLYTCEEMRRLVADNHPALDEDRSGILPHSFVPEWYGSERQQRLETPAIQLLHTESFYGPRTPLPLIDALRRVAQQVPLEGALRIDSYGRMDDRYRRLIADRGLDDVFAVHGFVAYLESLALMKGCDALLLIDASLTTTAESVFLPSKLIDYLGSHAPVIAVTPATGATARVVEETGGVVIPIERPEELDRLLMGMISDGEIPGAPRAEAISKYEYREVGRSLVGRLRALLD